MISAERQAAAAWQAADLNQDRSWGSALSEAAARQLADTVKAVFDPDRPLFDYRREDFDLGPAWDTIAAGRPAAHHGRGLARAPGPPRAGVG